MHTAEARHLVLGTVLILILILAVPVAAAPPGNPFVGSWEAPDSFDGSHQHMTIGGGPDMHDTFVDDAATVCLWEGYGFVPARARAFGEMTDDSTFEWTGDLYCMAREAGGPAFLFEATLTLEYNADTDTLTDQYDECWYRSGNPESCDLPGLAD